MSTITLCFTSALTSCSNPDIYLSTTLNNVNLQNSQNNGQKYVLITKKRLARLEFIEQNLSSIISTAVAMSLEATDLQHNK